MFYSLFVNVREQIREKQEKKSFDSGEKSSDAAEGCGDSCWDSGSSASQVVIGVWGSSHTLGITQK